MLRLLALSTAAVIYSLSVCGIDQSDVGVYYIALMLSVIMVRRRRKYSIDGDASFVGI
jgi:hypothetical protein